MFPRSKITGVNNGIIRSVAFNGSPVNAVAAGRSYAENKTEVAASLTFGGGGIGGMSSSSITSNFGSQYQYYMTGLLGADPNQTDTSNLAPFFRDAYLFDNVAGSSVDIQSTFPFSSWELRGLEDKELGFFDEATEQLNLLEKMPEISNSYLVDGFFCASLIFDQQTKKFTDALAHDAQSCSITPSNFFNMQPEIKVNTNGHTQQMLSSVSPYTQDFIDTMPTVFMDMLRSGSFTLNPSTTLYIARKTLGDRAYVSFLHRILPMYLIEKTMFRGTLIEAQRRQRAMTHLTAGDDIWTPTGEELQALVSQFQAAEYDPLGGWVSTRNAVQAQDLRPGGDFWKWTDMADILVPYKLRALGISEAFLSGDSSYNAQESAYSIFLETMNTYRLHLTNRIFTSTLFPLIAVANGLYKNPSNRVRGGSISKFLQVSGNRANLKIPTLHWHKSLEAKGEDNQFDMLEKASEKGVPIPLKTWMAAAGIDSDGLLKDLKDDKDLRAQLESYTGKNTSHEGEDHAGSPDDEDSDPSLEYAGKRLTTQNLAKVKNRIPLLSRTFGESSIVQMNKSGTSKKYVHNSRMKDRDINGQIAKISAEAARNPKYAEALKEANQRKFGHTTIPGAGDIKRR